MAMRKCIRCDETKDESEFNIRNFERNLLQSVCRDCQKEQGRERYLNHTERVKEINRRARERSQMQAALFIQEFLSGKSCVDCRENDMTVLTFDHVRGEKKMNVADMVTKGVAIDTIKNELEKTDIVCFNCPMRREQSLRGYSRFGRFGK